MQTVGFVILTIFIKHNLGNIEAGRKPSIQFASKFINIPTNITTRSKRSRDSYA